MAQQQSSQILGLSQNSLTVSNYTISELLETHDMVKYIQQLNNFLYNSQIGNSLEQLILSCIRMKKFQHFKLAYQLYMVKFNKVEINRVILTEVNRVMDIRFVAYMIYTLKIVNEIDQENYTLLKAAIVNEDLPIIRLLLINKAQIDIPDLENLMDYVLERNLTKIVILLISFNDSKPNKQSNIQKYENMQTKWYQLGFKQKLSQTYKENKGIKHHNIRKYILFFYFILNITLSLMIPFGFNQITEHNENHESTFEYSEYFRLGIITIITFTMIIHLFLCCFDNALPKPNLPLDILIDTNFSTNNLCLHCGGTKDLNTKHCDRCHSCTPKYSHHCIWIDNCVGGQIKITFKIFVVSLILICFCQIIVAMLILLGQIKSTYNPIPIFDNNISNYYTLIAITLLIINLIPFSVYIYIILKYFKSDHKIQHTSSSQDQLLNPTIQSLDMTGES